MCVQLGKEIADYLLLKNVIVPQSKNKITFSCGHTSIYPCFSAPFYFLRGFPILSTSLFFSAWYVYAVHCPCSKVVQERVN